MKQNILFRLFTLGLVVLVLFIVHCAESTKQSDKKVIEQLTEYLNSRMHGSQYKIDPETTIVKPIGNTRYHITLKNSVFTTDLIEIVNVISRYLSSMDDIYSEMNIGLMEEVTLIYGPEENFLRLLSIKGLSVEGDLSDAKGINKSSVFGGFEPDKISISIGKITFQYPEGYDFGSSETMEHLKIQVSGATAKKDNISILLDIEKIGKVDTGREEGNISDYLSDPNAQLPNLQTALDTGAAINDLNIQLGKVNISIKKNDSKLCEGAIENASYSQFMKPDDTGKSFKFGQGIQLKNLKLSIPGNKKLQLLSHVKEFCYVYSINNLSLGATLAFLDLIKNSFTLRNQVDSTGMKEYMTLVTKLTFEIMNSKTHMEIKIKPFKHYFGEMEAVVDLRLYNLMAGPILKLTVDIFKVKDILNRLREANVFPPSTLLQVEQFLEKHATKKENGNASIIYEMDINQLRNMLLKGNPLVPPKISESHPNKWEKDRTIENTISQAKLYRKNGKFDEAQKILNESLNKLTDIEQKKKIQIELSNLHYSWVQHLKKKYKYTKSIEHLKKALEIYKGALKISEEIGDRDSTIRALINMGTVYTTIGEMRKAKHYFEKALPICQSVGDHAKNAITLHYLMRLWESLNKVRLSIFYGKQFVNAYQKFRLDVTMLDKDIQENFSDRQKFAYRKLATLLISEGRLYEARQTLDILKEKEYLEFIGSDSPTGYRLSLQVDFTTFEERWLNKYNTILENISTVGKEYHSLMSKNNKTDSDKKQLEKLDFQLTKARKAYEEYLVKLEKAFEKYETITLIKKARSLETVLSYLDEKEACKNAALHYLVFGGRVNIILTTPNFPLIKWSEIDENELTGMIMKYRSLILELEKKMRGVSLRDPPDPSIAPLLKRKKIYEKELYNVIFNPIDEELKKYGATNLMISLDGVLRYIPLPVLWDGRSYLIQRYRMSIITMSSLTNIKDEPINEKRILGFGASRGGHGFPPLPYVGREIRSIVNDEEKGYDGLISGRAFIDDSFTKAAMINQLKYEKYPYVHISSHFKLNLGNERMSLLLMGDGSTMNLNEIRLKGKIFDGVALLVLSACQTGIGGGNGREIDGFAELAQERGAKSIIASLWPVADESTKELMVKFYRIMKEGKVTSKIEALRQAQLELAGLEDLLDKDKEGTGQLAKNKTQYNSSYFWGPFIMIGNWR